MQRRLLLSGIRSISPAVDVTNYVMLELGHPMHAHDRTLITGGFDVRFAAARGRRSSRSTTSTGKLDPGDVLIVDDVATAAIGGVMGAGTTEVRDSTTDVLLEAAVWDPAAVSRTQRRLHLVSEAGRRYERTVDPGDLGCGARPLRRAAGRDRRRDGRTHAHRLARRSATHGLVAGPGQHAGRPARPDRGRALPRGHRGARLTQIGGEVSVADGLLVVVPPSWRPDLKQPADLVEEVLRLEGLEQDPVGASARARRAVG